MQAGLVVKEHIVGTVLLVQAGHVMGANIMMPLLLAHSGGAG